MAGTGPGEDAQSALLFKKEATLSATEVAAGATDVPRCCDPAHARRPALPGTTLGT